MKTVSETDVLICGAGPTGLALALVLARYGVRFRLIEKMDAPFHGSRGKGLQPRTLEIFGDLGILDAIMAAGGPYPPQREYLDDGGWRDAPTTAPLAPTPSEPILQPLMLPQFLGEAVMRAKLSESGHQVEYGRELLTLETHEQAVEARIAGQAGEEQLRARYVVGADGGRSRVRHLLDIHLAGKTLGVRAMVADVTLTGLSRDFWHRFNAQDRARQIAICPLAGTDLFQVQAPIAANEANDASEAVDLTPAGLTRMIAERSGRDDISVLAVHWASAFDMHARLADRYRAGRIFLAGDAAHIHPPTGGQGLNTSVQDAYNLGWKLAAVLAGAAEKLLDTYEEERRPVAESMLGMSTRLLDAAGRGDLRRGRETQQLDLGYPESSLALTLPERLQGIAAGDRAPDAPITTAQGEARRLFDLLRGAHWTLIGFHVAPELVAPQHPHLHVHIFGPGGDLLDSQGHFVDAYAPAAGDWILVRPDGYIGAMVSSANLSALEEYLQAVGLSLHAR
ncbi:FAD-dependent oxidoreductase [Herbaspirillum lusitanum]|uniref:FAD-dependent oxidoreductase n=1 Tax=Herbaspirillum lusitanum TaxID=213312 RepID=A0ABW9AF83_9BURK